MTYLYRISGMTISTEVALAGADPLTHGDPDVTMQQGGVAHALASPFVSTPRWDADENHVLLRQAGVGRYLISHGTDVMFEPDAGVPASHCALYLQNTVITALLHQRGGIVLHASAVELDGVAFLFCGASGEGKSTIAAALLQQGCALVSDDVSVVSFNRSGDPVISPDGRDLKLADAAIDKLDLGCGRGLPAVGQPEKSYVLAPRRWAGETLPLGAIYSLQSGAGGAGISALPSALALKTLRRNAHRPRLVRGTGRNAGYFEATAKLLQHIGVFTLRRPRDLEHLPQTAEALKAHWRSLGPRPATPRTN